MFPLRDTIPSRTFPLVTIAIITVNTLVFLYELSLGPHLQDAMYVFGMTPALLTGQVEVAGTMPVWWPHGTLITSMFMHGGWMHLIGNMYFLWIFGDNVEDWLGRWRYLLCYVTSGVLASLAHLLMHWDSIVPTVGASGAIAGVLGAYMMLYPRARVVTFLTLGFFVELVEVPAVLFLGLWVLIQFFNGFLSSAVLGSGTGGIAWWAHVWGFLIGVGFIKVVRRFSWRPWW